MEFQVVSDPEAEEPVDVRSAQSTFEAAMATMGTFMGSPVLNAVSSGRVIVTPNTPTEEDEAGEFTFTD